MNKNYLTCGTITIIGIVAIVVGLIFGLNAIQKSLENSFYQSLGFANEKEYLDFVEVINEPYDESTFYQNIYTQSDIDYVVNQLKENITTNNSQPIFFDNGYLNISAFDEENNATFINKILFSHNEYAYFGSLLLTSLFADEGTEKNELSDVQILKYTVLSSSHTVILKLNTQELKNSLGKYSNVLPNDLYITLNYDIIISNNEYKSTNQKIQFNLLNEEYNNKCISLLNNILSSHPAVMFSELVTTLINSFDKSTNSKTIFSNDKIIIGGV